ncbi:MAG TPA: hypothetical protein VFQ35_21190 [Polyangiaceae bacterium]|nr:hypothetical protein [Polyangiaceae bacterium]
MCKASLSSSRMLLAVACSAFTALFSCTGENDSSSSGGSTAAGGAASGGSHAGGAPPAASGGAHAGGAPVGASGGAARGGTHAGGAPASTGGDASGPAGAAGEGGAAGSGASSGAGWPNASNTGVPPGTQLTDYTTSCTITVNGTIVDSKRINCDLVIRAADVVIKNSKVKGLVYLDTDQPSSKDWSLTLQDSEVDGGPVQRAAVSDGNMTIIRANIYGGETAVHCGEKALTCRIQDSWLHGQYMPDDVDWHLGGFQSNGGTNIQLIHNTVICDHPANRVGGGCTGDINLIPDWATISFVTVDRNFLGANTDASYCTYGGEKSTSDYPHADHIVYTNNVFARGTNKKCGAFGPVTSFNSQGTGNVWTNNTWEDGGAIQPEN